MTVGIDPVLSAPRPQFTTDDAVGIAAATFGATAAIARNLGSERDQAFLLVDDHGEAVGVMKVSNPAESTAMLDMEALVAAHIAGVDPELPVARPWSAPGAETAGPERYRVLAEGCWVRMYDVIPGRGRSDPLTFGDDVLTAWGCTTARLSRATRGFFHHAAGRVMPWDVQHALSVRPMVPCIADHGWRTTVTATLDRYETVVAPAWSALRAQIVHGDLSTDNALVDDDGRVTGIVDFGDMSHSASIIDLVAALDSLGTGRAGRELLRVGRLIIDGYQRVLVLEPAELSILGELWAARAAIGVAISSWRVEQGLEDAAFAERYNPTAMEMVETLQSVGWQLDPPRRPGHGTLAMRRETAFGPGLEALSYDEPIEVVSARGVWLTAADGRRYLDMYNNVPCVGHAHPRVSEAIARQVRVLNTNVRYLDRSAIELAERLADRCPAGLDTVVFVNSGSEANDLAWRMACATTGRTGGLCTSFAYHGVTDAIAAFSPETWPVGYAPDHIERWTPPDALRSINLGPDGFASAIDRLSSDERGRDRRPVRGHGLAAVMFDGVLQSDGVLDLTAGYVHDLVERTREVGGLWIADEVQGGHGRTGLGLWSFERFGIIPDFITLGKPMGNGHPVAAVITRRSIAAAFGAAQGTFFSTFGGNQVSVAAASAVLDVLDDENVIERTAIVGHQLREALRWLTIDDDWVGDVRGVGLANAVEVVTDRTTNTPDPRRAAAFKNALRRHGVLVGTAGPLGNVLKIRPPLAFRSNHVAPFADGWDAARSSLLASRRPATT